jgi:hypothetical protein
VEFQGFIYAVPNSTMDGGNSLQEWRVSSHRQLARGGHSAWGLGEGLTSPHLKKTNLLQNVTQGLGIGGLL